MFSHFHSQPRNLFENCRNLSYLFLGFCFCFFPAVRFWSGRQTRARLCLESHSGAVRQVRLLQRNFDVNSETPVRIDGKQTGQSNIAGDAAAPACDAQAASLRSSWALMKMDYWASAVECAAAASRVEAAHLDCPIPAPPAGGLINHKSTQLFSWIRFQCRCEDV